MTRALLWKEFREQRPLVLAAWVIALVLPVFLVVGMAVTTPRYEIAALGQMLPTVLALLVWPVFGAATGATTVAADMSDGSLRFLLSRPVSRSRLWFAKVVAAAAAMTLVILGSIFIATAFDSLLTGQLRFFGGAEPVIGFGAIAAMLFIGAHYCSLFFRRPLAAALAGIVVSASMAAVVSGLWRLAIHPESQIGGDFFEIGFLAAPPLAMFGLLVAAWWVFSRGDLLGGNTAWRMAVSLVIVTLVVALLGAAPATYFSLRSATARAAGLSHEVGLVDGRAALVQAALSGTRTRVALVDLRRGDAELVGARNVAQPAMSADGSLIAYVHFGGVAGLSRGEADVRVVSTDGSDDRRAIERVPFTRFDSYLSVLSISPDNRFVAWYRGGTVAWVGSLDERGEDPILLHLTDPERTRDPRREYPGGSAVLLGWTRATDSELLFARVGPPDAPHPSTELIAADPVTGAERIVAVFPGRDDTQLRGNAFSATSNRGWRWYPRWIGDDGERRLVLLDVLTGEHVVVSDSPCDSWGFAANDDRFVYGHCGGERHGARVELRERDLVTGGDQTFAVLEGMWRASYSAELLVSPDGDRIAMRAVRGRNSFGTYVVTRGGGAPLVDARAVSTPAELSPSPAARLELVSVSLYPLGWLDNDHLVIVDSRGPNVDIEVINVETHAVREVYSQ